jgi:uncharacterized protein (TIGR02466 family)
MADEPMQDIDVRQHVAMAYATPLVLYTWPDSDELNAELKALALKLEAEAQGIQRSNIGGWHSELTFLSRPEPCLARLRERISILTKSLTKAVTAPNAATPQRQLNFRLDGWANVTRHGGYNTVHCHPGAYWSGVYYVSNGEPETDRPQNGKLEFVDPRAGINQVYLKGTIFEGRYIVEPTPGMMAMFPSWLQHFVHPYFGTGERISIAFNVQANEVIVS